MLRGRVNFEEGELPSLSLSLPKERKLNGTDRYVVGPIILGRIKEFAGLKDAVNFAGGTQAVIANYRNGNGQMSLAIFEFHTPQLATDSYTQIKKYFDGLLPSERSSRLLKRIGNYIVIAANVQDILDAEALISQIKYSPKIYWEGKKITNIPIQFRPPDPVVIEEASQTANIIIRTFYWIGMMISGAIVVGFIVGSSLFYWNRYQQHKPSADGVFSAVDEIVRLKVDD